MNQNLFSQVPWVNKDNKKLQILLPIVLSLIREVVDRIMCAVHISNVCLEEFA